jgi:ribosome biogenesis protein Nip4
MSMPEFPKLGDLTLEQAVNSILVSVAMEEAALSHILNAEGEKMQAIIAMKYVTPEELLELNDSVIKLVNSVTRLEMMFQAKLELFSDEETTG